MNLNKDISFHVKPDLDIVYNNDILLYLRL